MAYDEALADRIGVILKDQPNVVGKKMFGGIAFMVHGNAETNQMRVSWPIKKNEWKKFLLFYYSWVFHPCRPNTF